MDSVCDAQHLVPDDAHARMERMERRDHANPAATIKANSANGNANANSEDTSNANSEDTSNASTLGNSNLDRASE